MTTTNEFLQRIYLVSYVIVCSLTKWTRVGLSGNPITMFQWYFYHQRLAVWYHVTSITCAIWMRRQLRARILSMWFLSTPNCLINVIQKALSCSNHLRAWLGLIWRIWRLTWLHNRHLCQHQLLRSLLHLHPFSCSSNPFNPLNLVGRAGPRRIRESFNATLLHWRNCLTEIKSTIILAPYAQLTVIMSAKLRQMWLRVKNIVILIRACLECRSLIVRQPISLLATSGCGQRLVA